MGGSVNRRGVGVGDRGSGATTSRGWGGCTDAGEDSSKWGGTIWWQVLQSSWRRPRRKSLTWVIIVQLWVDPVLFWILLSRISISSFPSLAAERPSRVRDLFRVLGSEGNLQTVGLLFLLCYQNTKAMFWIFKRTFKTPLFVSASVQHLCHPRTGGW